MFFSIAFGLLFGLFFSLIVGLIKPKWVCFSSRVSILKSIGIIFVLMIILGMMLDGERNEHGILTFISFLVGFLVLFILDIKLNIFDKKENKSRQEKDKKTLSPINLKMTVTKNYGSNGYEIEHYEENKDSFEGWFYDEVPDYMELDKVLRIKYKDANEKVTERTIRVRKFGKAYFGGFILSHCYMRESSRTFRTDRILECVDNDTGEVIADVSQYLINIYKSTPRYKQMIKKEQEAEYYYMFTKKYEVLLKVLAYIVKCDGTYNVKEKAIVKELFDELEKDNELLTDKMLTKVFKDTPLPTFRSFQVNVTKLISNNEFEFNIVEFSENVIATQRSVHSREAELLLYLEKKFSIDGLSSRVYEKVKGIKAEQKKYFKSDKVCPNCKSDHVTKKGQRVLKKGKIQRYQCQGCAKVFSEEIDF